MANVPQNVFGFETGDLTEATGLFATSGNTCAVSNAFANRTPPYPPTSYSCHLKQTTNGGDAHFIVPGLDTQGVQNSTVSLTTPFLRAYFYPITITAVSGNGAQLTPLMFFFNGAGQSQTLPAGLYLNSSAQIVLRDVNTTYHTSTAVVPLNTWSWLAFTINTTSGAWSARLNGLQILSGTTTGNLTITSVQVGWTSSQNFEMYVDDIWLDSSAYPPPGGTQNFVGFSNGVYTGWTPTGTIPNSIPMSGTQTITGTTTNEARSVVTNANIVPGSTINAVKSNHYAKAVGGAVHLICRLVSGGSVLDTVSTTSVAGVFTPFAEVTVTDPATSSAWTVAAANAAQPGIVMGNTASGSMQCDALYLMVDYLGVIGSISSSSSSSASSLAASSSSRRSSGSPSVSATASASSIFASLASSSSSVSPAGNLRLTQEAVRVLVTPTDANLRMTQEAIRVLVTPTTNNLRMTQMPIRILAAAPIPPSSSSSSISTVSIHPSSVIPSSFRASSITPSSAAPSQVPSSIIASSFGVSSMAPASSIGPSSFKASSPAAPSSLAAPSSAIAPSSAAAPSSATAPSSAILASSVVAVSSITPASSVTPTVSSAAPTSSVAPVLSSAAPTSSVAPTASSEAPASSVAPPASSAAPAASSFAASPSAAQSVASSAASIGSASASGSAFGAPSIAGGGPFRIEIYTSDFSLVARVDVPWPIPPLLLYQGRFYVYSSWRLSAYEQVDAYVPPSDAGSPPWSVIAFPEF